MCDCYGHKCECCDERVPMHIADFNYPREDFKMWCHDHVDKAEPGAIIFELIVEDEEGWDGIPVGWKCAIKGPRVGEEGGNTPNLASRFRESVVEEE